MKWNDEKEDCSEGIGERREQQRLKGERMEEGGERREIGGEREEEKG